MKKKIFLVLAIMAMLVCAFAISVSASITTYDDAPTRTILEMNNDEYVVFDDGFSCPSYYIIPDQEQLINTDYSYINQKTGRTYTDDNVVEMHVPTGIKDMNKRFGAWKIFTNCTVVGVPSTATPKDQFGSTSTVTKVYLADGITEIPEWAFSATSTLEEIVISENSNLKVIYGGAFNGCQSLKYLYLPDGFKSFDSSNGTKVFNNFNSTGFGFLNSPDETEIPDVYFFPESFEYSEACLWGSRVSNNTVVLPSSVHSIPGAYDMDNTNIKKLVLLSDKVTTVNLNNASAAQIIYFPNMSSTDMNGDFFKAGNTEIQETITGKTFTPSFRRGGQQYYYFGVDKKWTRSQWSNNLQKSGFQLFSNMSESDHIYAYTNVQEANCENPRATITSCICGYQKAPVTEGSALGHNHTIFVGLTYTNYLENGCYSYKCERCDDVNNDKSAPALFTSSGYSAPEEGAGGITVDYRANLDAIAEYERVTGETISYGLYVATQNTLGNKYVFDENGVAIDGAVTIALSRKYTKMTVKLFGFETDELKATKFAVGAYVEAISTEGEEISYLQSGKVADGEKYAFVSYNDVVNNA